MNIRCAVNASGRIIVIWASTPLKHRVSKHFEGGGDRVITVGRRGIAAPAVAVIVPRLTPRMSVLLVVVAAAIGAVSFLLKFMLTQGIRHVENVINTAIADTTDIVNDQALPERWHREATRSVASPPTRAAARPRRGWSCSGWTRCSRNWSAARSCRGDAGLRDGAAAQGPRALGGARLVGDRFASRATVDCRADGGRAVCRSFRR